ncbi:MAG: carboxypeptidase M32 [Rhodospirillales bacterium]|nr:MAG: carboxypeptidase M32 [Rhodospirillales bacterium]
MPQNAYQKLEALFARLLRIEDAIAILQWDAAVMMPTGGAVSRGEEIATLKGLHHKMLAGPSVAGLICKANHLDLNDWQRANLAEMSRQWIHAHAVPARLIEALARATSACEMVWRGSRAKGDFKAVRKPLEKVVALTREAGEAKAEPLGVTPYEALMDLYEPEASEKRIEPLFADLEQFIARTLPRVLERQGGAEPPPCPPVPEARQKELGRRLMGVLGFDFSKGRLDESAHPFSGGTPYDVRITTRYDEDEPLKSLMGVAHETGHALYEMNLPEDWRHQPVGRARGMGMHESQSLIVEMQACRSKEFTRFLAPLMTEMLEVSGTEWEAKALWRRLAWVKPGFIRVDADELTYSAHVILRFRLERAMIRGDLKVADLPGAWNECMRRLLGIVPKSDREGCLQDIHWYDGAIGYFPSYTLGALAAAQLFQAAERAVPELRVRLGQGDFAPLMGWLKTHVHGQGCKGSTDDILMRATGHPLEARFFEAHIERRYLSER